TQAAFEAVSGWTSTGLTTLDVENAPRIILMYRSITQVVGGAGFVIIMMSAIAGPAGIGLTSAEGRNAQLVPNIRDSANIVLRIYVGYMVFGVIALAIAGMPLFDALNHGLTAVSTGGFSTRAESIGYYDSVAIEGVIIEMMWLGATKLLTV
ncbi:MAG: potassium transporter TrkG, partial [Anaerolineae bacterium]